MKIEEKLSVHCKLWAVHRLDSGIITEQLVESNTKKVSDKYERRSISEHVCVYVNGLVKVGQQSK